MRPRQIGFSVVALLASSALVIGGALASTSCSGGDTPAIATDARANVAADGGGGGGGGGGAGDGDGRTDKDIGTPLGSTGAAACDADPGVIMLWRYFHREAFATTLPPAAGGDWLLYMDPASPDQHFLYPPGWHTERIPRTNGSYVLVTSADGKSSITISSEFLPQGQEPAGVLCQEALEMLLGETTPMCHDEFQKPGVSHAFEVVAAGDNGTTRAFAYGAAIYNNGTYAVPPNTIVTSAVRSFSAPSGEFARTTWNVFLPIMIQMMNIGHPEEKDE